MVLRLTSSKSNNRKLLEHDEIKSTPFSLRQILI